ncbi:uncharacterized protein BDW70DRAFT_83255 [Aspergillus foveolatus]|uniref:uncharacterized protein n=1 Tax=Aspergillus foveolatus TaxID=210207 RepID=UPI003CCCEE3E
MTFSPGRAQPCSFLVSGIAGMVGVPGRSIGCATCLRQRSRYVFSLHQNFRYDLLTRMNSATWKNRPVATVTKRALSATDITVPAYSSHNRDPKRTPC